MAAQEIGISTAAAVALTATTPKTVLSAQAPANIPVRLKRLKGGFDNVDVTKAGVLVEICQWDLNAAGTNTAATVTKTDSGRPETVQTTGKYNFTVEATNLVVIETMLVPSFNGSFDLPLTGVIKGGYGVCIRLTSPVNTNFYGTLKVEE